MNRLLCRRHRLGLLVLLAACGHPAKPDNAAGPTLPALALQPFLPTLKAIAATMPQPSEAEQHEVKELGDIALQLVEVDSRTASRGERALLEHPFAWWALEPALQHEQIATRRRAAWLCGRSGQSVLQLPLLLRLKYELDSEAVLWVAEALQRLGNDTGLDWLDAAMNQDRTAEKAGTLSIEICRERGMALSESPTYVELQGKLRELSAAWRQHGKSSRADVAAPAADQLEPRLAIHLITTESTPLRPIDDARYVLTRAGHLAVPLLVRTLSASEPYLRTMALQVLAELGPVASDATPAVMPLLGDALTSSYAMRTLGEVGATTAIPYLRNQLQQPDVELRAAATQALGLLHDTASQPALVARLQDAQEALDVRVGAAFGLLCLGPDAAAEAFLAERESRGDYHAPTLARLRERLRAASH